MSTAERVGSATLATTPENAARIAIIHRPDQIDAQRVLAPAATFKAVWPTEPPTGCPLKNPDARLPTPWATKSRLASESEPSGLRADSATPAPWTKTMTATAKAPVTTLSDSSLSFGRCGNGIPLGMAPADETRATVSKPATMTTSEGTTSATTAATLRNRRVAYHRDDA